VQGVIQQIVALRFFILWVVWLGGLGVGSFLLLSKQQAYYQHFSLMDRSKAMWQRQADPELEQLRRAVWRGYGYGVLWGLGFPLITVGALQLWP
jgi:hypothetical protein